MQRRHGPGYEFIVTDRDARDALGRGHEKLVRALKIREAPRFLYPTQRYPDNRRIQDEDDDQVTTKPGERRRLHGSKSLSHFCLLCTDRSLRRAHETFLHLHHLSMQVRAAQYPARVASPATSTAPLNASSVSATPTLATSAGKHVAHSPPTLLADSSFQAFRQWRRLWEDYSTMPGFTEAATTQATHPAADGCVTGRTKDLRTHPRDRT
ncbi:hypothetical protein GWK47_029679 [Chionoecetes opilio]|uniref:Uncharacterized protein n=1 Tax=Chionoecetes opilio TaxID=41210 RepID=A0A8J5D2Y3_CHIOP|nr:hypothetical protein GWK47_029679 [Chionoecetes opilio]